MKTKHTPGPWTLHYPVGHDFHVGNTVYNVASIFELNDLEEQEANAKIIAASPIMLDALVRVVEGYEGGEYTADQVVRFAKEAIKKATS